MKDDKRVHLKIKVADLELKLDKLQANFNLLKETYTKLTKKNEELRHGIINDRNDVVLVPKAIYETFDALKDSRDKLVEALESADLSLVECAKYLMGTGLVPDSEAMAFTMIQVKQALKEAKEIK